jgi:hypothetical protein
MGADIDCNDTTASFSPGAAETCDGLDQDCDGVPDDGIATTTLYEDRDRDGRYGTAVTACMGTPGTSTINNDCDDSDANTFQGQTMYFGTPTCRGPGGWFACFSGGSWQCYDIGAIMGCGIARGRPRPVPTWDYDCSGTPERIPDRNQGCSALLSCSTFPGCVGESGYDYDPAAPPACGAQISGAVVPRHWFCGCDGARRCMANHDTQYFPCR